MYFTVIILHELLKCRSLIIHIFIAITVRMIPSKRAGGGNSIGPPKIHYLAQAKELQRSLLSLHFFDDAWAFQIGLSPHTY